jgi:hypothetical protein
VTAIQSSPSSQLRQITQGMRGGVPVRELRRHHPGLSEDKQPNTKKRKEHPVKPKGAKKFKINLLDKKFSSVHLNDLKQNII